MAGFCVDGGLAIVFFASMYGRRLLILIIC
jgi:hypothetical protein